MFGRHVMLLAMLGCVSLPVDLHELTVVTVENVSDLPARCERLGKVTGSDGKIGPWWNRKDGEDMVH